jgi:hypothetical protein
MTHRVTGILTLAVLVVVAAGCGGGGGKSGVAGASTTRTAPTATAAPATPPAQCRNVRNTTASIRATVERDVLNASRSTDKAELQNRLAVLRADLRSGRQQLASVQTTGAVHVQVQRLRSALRSLQAGLDRASRDARAGRLVQALATLPQASAAQIVDSARRIRTLCGS